MTSPSDGRDVELTLAEWCRIEREKLGALDGYDYRSGEEYGIRRVEIEIRKRAAATLSPSPGERKDFG